MDTTPAGPNKPALYRFAGAILCAVAAFLIVPSIHEIREARQASDWAARSARITTSELATYGGGRAGDPPRHALHMKGVFLDTGEAFTVERIAFGGVADVDEIRRIVREHAAGSEMLVYAEPGDPGRVVLARQAAVGSMYLLIGLGSVFAALGITSILKARRHRSPAVRQ